jgi:hypothetical protein
MDSLFHNDLATHNEIRHTVLRFLKSAWAFHRGDTTPFPPQWDANAARDGDPVSRRVRAIREPSDTRALDPTSVAACIFRTGRTWLDNGIDCGVLVAAFVRAAVTGAALATSSALNSIPFNACGVAALRRHLRLQYLELAM